MHPSDNHAHLLDLVSLIASSVNDVIDEYRSAGTCVRSLDSDIIEDGPFDVPQNISQKLADAVKIIEAACAQLVATVQTPGLSLADGALSYLTPACLKVVVKAKVADHLKGRPGVPIAELGKLTGVEGGKLQRVLKFLSVRHIFREVEPGVFANNRLSTKLLSENATYDIINLLTHDFFPTGHVLAETLLDDSPSAPKAAFEMFYGAPLFPFMSSLAGAEMAPRFTKGMIGWGHVMGQALLQTSYPWDPALKSSEEIKICDVAGGTGHVVLSLMNALPEFPFSAVIQDLPKLAEPSKQFWEKSGGNFVREGRVEFVPFDFFKDPPVKGCDYYYVRHTLHNWSDEHCLQILSNVVEAMKINPGSRLLVDDLAIRYEANSQEPYMPANLGVPRALGWDLMMLLFLGDAKERTVGELIELGKRVGLELLDVYNSGPTFESILEFKLA